LDLPSTVVAELFTGSDANPSAGNVTLRLFDHPQLFSINCQRDGAHDQPEIRWIALPPDRCPWTKMLALVVRPQVNLPKHFAGAVPAFLMRDQSFKSLEWTKSGELLS